MKKVALFGGPDATEFQNAVNAFIADKNVVDIQYKAVVIDNHSTITVADRALIIYEVGDDDQYGY